jgi:hypothetical protein
LKIFFSFIVLGCFLKQAILLLGFLIRLLGVSFVDRQLGIGKLEETGGL